MSSIGTGYDLSAHQFSPDGRVFQVEYANKAVDNSSTAVAVRCVDGVVFGVEKLITSKLYEPSTGKRIFTIDKHVGMSVAGLISDARELVDVARDEAANYRAEYSESIPLHYLAQCVAGYVHMFTCYSSYRPFGCSVFLSSYDEMDGATLYVIEPSGVFYGYKGSAIGKAKQNAKTEIEKLNLATLTMKEAVREVAKIIYIVHDEVKDKNFQLELSWVGKESNGLHKMVPKDLAAEVEEQAKKSLEEDSDSDGDL